jgi:altronate dehydratase
LGHKFALLNIKKGELIRKYGEIIGVATQDIKEGDWIHIHNIKSHYLEKDEK